MMANETKENVTYNSPTITPKVYLSKTSAGWPETFDRKKVDAELAAFLAPLDVDEVVEMFIESRALGEKHADRIIAWHTIIGYLSRTMSVRFDLVPHTVGIAFWGHVVISMKDNEGN